MSRGKVGAGRTATYNQRMNSTSHLLDQLDLRIVAVLRAALPGVEAVYRYGGFGGEYERPDSDLDLAVLGQVKLDVATRMRLTALLEITAGQSPHVIPLIRLGSPKAPHIYLRERY